MEMITLFILILGLLIFVIPIVFLSYLISDIRAKTRKSISCLPALLVIFIPLLIVLFIPALRIKDFHLFLRSPVNAILLLAWYGVIFVTSILSTHRENNIKTMDVLRNLISVNTLKGIGMAVMWAVAAGIGGLGGIWISSLVFPAHNSRDSGFIGTVFGLLGVFGAVKLFGYLLNLQKTRAQQKQSKEKPAGRLVNIQITCPYCGKMTNAILPNNGDERDNEPEIKCEQCKKVFNFKVGMPYKPIGYVN